jgi:hypothetical protein
MTWQQWLCTVWIVLVVVPELPKFFIIPLQYLKDERYHSLGYAFPEREPLGSTRWWLFLHIAVCLWHCYEKYRVLMVYFSTPSKWINTRPDVMRRFLLSGVALVVTNLHNLPVQSTFTTWEALIRNVPATVLFSWMCWHIATAKPFRPIVLYLHWSLISINMYFQLPTMIMWFYNNSYRLDAVVGSFIYDIGLLLCNVVTTNCS